MTRAPALLFLFAVFVTKTVRSCCYSFHLFVDRISPRAGEAGRLMSTMMSNVTQALKRLPSISVAAIDGWQNSRSSHLLSNFQYQALQSAAALSFAAHVICAACRNLLPFGTAVLFILVFVLISFRFVQAERGVTPGWGGARSLSNVFVFVTTWLLVAEFKHVLQIVGQSRAMALLLTRQNLSSDEVCMPLYRGMQRIALPLNLVPLILY
jgi:hypothetical protein